MFCLQTNFLIPMTFDPKTQLPIVESEYKKWLNAGNRGPRSAFICERLVGYSKANDKVKELEDKVEEQASRLALLGKETKKEVPEKIKFEEEIEKYKQELQATKAELEKMRKDFESSKALLAQQEKTFATKADESESLRQQLQSKDAELASATKGLREIKEQLASFHSKLQESGEKRRAMEQQFQTATKETVKEVKKEAEKEPAKELEGKQEWINWENFKKKFKNPEQLGVVLGIDVYGIKALRDFLKKNDIKLKDILDLSYWNEGENIFGYLATKGFFNTLKAFIYEAKKDNLNLKGYLNKKDKFGNTSLHRAFKPITAVINKDGMKKVVKMLLENGADISIKNNKGETPLQIQIDKRFTPAEIIQELNDEAERRKKEITLTGPFFTDLLAGLENEKWDVKNYLEKAFGEYEEWKEVLKKELTFRDGYNKNVFHYLIERSQSALAINAVSFLIDESKKLKYGPVLKEALNFQDNLGNTPLHYALERLNLVRNSKADADVFVKIINELLNNSASALVLNNEGDTPINLVDYFKLRSKLIKFPKD